MIRKFIVWLLAWWRPVSPLPSAIVEPGQVLAPPAPPVVAGMDDDIFHFRGSVLDQLDRYVKIMARAKRALGEDWHFYNRYGAWLFPPGRWKGGSVRAQDEPIEPFFLRSRPTFGMVVYTDPGTAAFDRKKEWVPAAIYFRKYAAGHAPIEIQPSAGDVYVVGLLWDKLDASRRHGTPTEFAARVNGDGSISILKTLRSVEQRISVKRGNLRRDRHLTIQHRRWALDEFFVDWARQHEASPDDFLRGFFIEAANHYVRSAMGSPIRVRIKKGSTSALLAIDALRTPAFFKDRDLTVTKSGARRRVFHVVRTHVRRDGATVRMHFRGERRFMWNGYGVEISVPGRDHIELADFPVGAVEAETADEPLEAMHTPGTLASRFLEIERRPR